MPSISPFLSIVLVARNDNYSGDFNERLHNAMYWLAWLIEKHKLPAEILIVDYNPVPENEPLVKMLRWPKSRYLTIRLIHVPGEIHQALINPDVRKTVPLFEFNAKNMAIRRAGGEYILSTNADILLHPSIIKFISGKMPCKKSYYRTDRYDFRRLDFYDFDNPYFTLRKVQRNVFRLMLKGYAYPVKRGENLAEKIISRIKNSRRIFFDIHLSKVKPLAYKWEINVNHDGYLMKYHTHCSGDFMLMHRDHWFSLRGYPEDTYISTHCDAIFTVMSRMLGLKEAILPWPIYHQDHERRYNTDFDKIKNNEDINRMFKRFLKDTHEMETSRQPKIVNPPDWGHANENFLETIV